MHKPFLNHYKQAWNNLRKEIRPVVGFEIWFSLIYAAVLVPLTAWSLNKLLVPGGPLAVSNEDIITFFLSPLGVLFVLLSIAFFLGLAFLEQVGLIVISLAAVEGRVLSASSALWESLAHFLPIIRLGLLQAMVFGAASLPFLAAGALTYVSFLGEHDINYYLSAQPWQWWAALVISGIIFVSYLVVAAYLYIRWLFAIPVLIFENARPVEALKKSWQRTRYRILALGMPQAVWWIFILIASIVTTLVFKTFFAYVLAHAGLKLVIILPLVLVALAVIVITDVSWFIIGKAIHMFLIVDFYRETVTNKTKASEESRVLKKLSPSILKKLGWVGICFALVAAIISGVTFLKNLNFDRHIAVTAHRGSSLKAPENTMSALRQAIADGADYAEIDVQTTADGVVILMHDADLMRIASVNRRIQDTRFEELKEIDIGSWFSGDFSNERTAILDEAIKLVNGRIKLNIELKYNRPDPGLMGKVGNIIRSNAFSRKCVITSLNNGELQTFRKSFPEIKTGLIVFRALGSLTKTEFDFLSIQATKATSRLVKNAHKKGKEIHVWTVNDLQTALSMIEVGVDNIITDKPDFIRNLLRTWNDFTDTEKIALWLRNLIIEDDPALVAKL